jgi:hypothetical protein
MRANRSLGKRWSGLAMVVVGLGAIGMGAGYEGSPLPAKTVMLSEMMRELSAQPGFTDMLLDKIQNGSKAGALLTPELVHRMRELILGKDWEGLDRFPGWTMRQINPTVKVVSKVAGKDPEVKGMATAGGAPSGTPRSSASGVTAYVEIGPYALDRPHVEDLDKPSTRPGFDEKELVSTLGDDVVRGDGANAPIAAMHPESARLAEVLNRLSLNGQDGAAPMRATIGGHGAGSPQELIAALTATGHEVMVADSRYFANFGHLHYKGQDVMMPFWVNSQIIVPETKRPLLVPVSHAEYEWFVRGPKINAEVSFYFGIDGKAEWRTMDQLDQAWVMNRHAHEYRGADAVEVTRLSGELVRAYLHEHVARPTLPFGGYYALGVCQDVVAAIELKMTGRTTLFPNTADASLFEDPRDAEINGLIHRIPKDRDGDAPQVSRIFGSLPVSEDKLDTITIPGLSADLIAVDAAWKDGTLQRTRPMWRVWLNRGLLWGGFLLALGVAGTLYRRSRRED